MAFCENCGAPLSAGAKFCENCGAPVAPVPRTGASGHAVPSTTPVQATMPLVVPDVVQGGQPLLRPPAGSSIAVGEDGTYRWVYEYSLWRDPTMFLTVFKVFGGVGLGLVVLMTVFDIVGGNWAYVDLADRLRFDAIILAITCGLALVGYAIFALISGGKYCVLFTMDEETVEFRALPKEVKRAEAISMLNVLMGLAAGNPTQVGIGLTTASNNVMVSDFSNVRSIQGYPGRGVIKVNEPLAKNQVYVERGDYDFVYGYIRERCPRATIRG